MKHFALALAVAVSGCATTFGVRDVDPSEVSGLALKLQDYPSNRDYKTVGMIEISAYRAGLSQPTADDVWEEVSKAVASKGGNACIVRKQKPDDVFARRVWVTCEVLAVSDLK